MVTYAGFSLVQGLTHSEACLRLHGTLSCFAPFDLLLGLHVLETREAELVATPYPSLVLHRYPCPEEIGVNFGIQ